jgi:short-subunit dehydrogenase
MKTIVFQNKVCWITGASGGIGAALAMALNKAGAYLVLSSRSAEKLNEVKQACEYPDKIEMMVCDMEETEKLNAAATTAWKMFNHIDYVFLNAGIALRDLAINTEFDMVKKVMTVNFFSNVIITKALLPLMKQRGSGNFVVTSSICGKAGVPKLSAYSASKHALHGFYDSLRVESEDYGVRITIITAGFVRTDITRNALLGDGTAYNRMQESVAHGMAPENCAKHILHAVAVGKREILIGGSEKYGVWIKRFFPALYASVISKHPLKKLRDLRFLKRTLFKKIISDRENQNSYVLASTK